MDSKRDKFTISIIARIGQIPLLTSKMRKRGHPNGTQFLFTLSTNTTKCHN